MGNVEWDPGLSAKSHKHKWDLAPKQAVRVQEELRSMVVIEPIETLNLRLIAGVDVGTVTQRQSEAFAQAGVPLPVAAASETSS